MGWYAGDGVADLAETLYVQAEGLVVLSLHSVKVRLLPAARVCALEVRNELLAQILPGVDGVGRLGHQTAARLTLEGHGEVIRHDPVVAPCRHDNRGVDLEELGGIDAAIILLREVGAKL
jgi:hypothetical protein